MNNLPKQLSVRQAAEIFGMSENTLRAYISRKIVPHRRVRGRVYFVTETLEKWLSEFDIEPRQPDGDDEEKD